jgi:ribonuclease HII
LKTYKGIVGCDEVGRGPIAGPVTACAVKIAKKNLGVLKELVNVNVTDSKKLTDKKRQIILEKLGIDVHELVLAKNYKVKMAGGFFEFCLFEHDHNEIDEMNILQASLSAMKLASESLDPKDCLILIDGNKEFQSDYNRQSVVKGDSKVVAIGMASIIAKVFRDEKMKHYDSIYPGYNLKKHAGYPTKEHKDAVKKLGPSPIHRKSFKGVKEYL